MTLPDNFVREVLDRLRPANQSVARRYPGDGGARQPIHTVYGGAHLFTVDTLAQLGERARRALDRDAPDEETFAAAMGLTPEVGEKVLPRVRAKLAREPVEDYRLDFEDGYGSRPDAEEDAHAVSAAAELAAAVRPPFVGIRIKAFTDELAARSIRTLDRFVTTLVERAGALPAGFTVTLSKITAPEQVAALAAVLGALEERLGLSSLTMELMVETPQCIFDLARLASASAGRCRGAHFGTYDYTAGCDVTAAHQRMRHPACDFAKQVMKATLAGTGVWLSDGSTIVLPTGDRAAVHAAWRLHADDVRDSLVAGFYQGWDLHPGQLPSRYAAVYGFFVEGLPAATARLQNYLAQTTKAEIADEIATGQALLGFFLRGLSCGAITEEEARATGLTVDEMRGRSFAAILRGRRAQLPR